MSLLANKPQRILMDHEKLIVYQVAMEFVIFANETVSQLPKGKAYLNDQLQRAALSISLNIAEGAGELSPDEKMRFYRMARRSSTECASILDVCLSLELIDDEQYEKGKNLLIRIVSMLTKMTQK
jgi:four helix bundle protein